MNVLRWVGMVAVLALVSVGGCGPSHNSVEEADRQGLDVQRQILLSQDVELDRIETAVNEEPIDPLRALAIKAAVSGMREKNRDAKDINAQLLTNFRPPQQPTVYSHAEVQSLLKRMHDSHQTTFWASVGAALVAGGTFVIGLARSPLAKMIPGVGTILTSLDGTMAAIETWMTKMKESGKPEIAAGLASVLQEAHKVPAVQRFIEKRLDLVQAEAPRVMPAPEIQVATALAADAAVDSLAAPSMN